MDPCSVPWLWWWSHESIHVIKLYTTKYTHRIPCKLVKSECWWIAYTSISRLWYSSTVMQGVIVGGDWVKGKGVSLYYLLQLRMNLEFPQNEKFILKQRRKVIKQLALWRIFQAKEITCLEVGKGLDNLRGLKERVVRARTASRCVGSNEAGEEGRAYHMGFMALSALWDFYLKCNWRIWSRTVMWSDLFFRAISDFMENGWEVDESGRGETSAKVQVSEVADPDYNSWGWFGEIWTLFRGILQVEFAQYSNEMYGEG